MPRANMPVGRFPGKVFLIPRGRPLRNEESTGYEPSQGVFPGTSLFRMKTGHVTTMSPIPHQGKPALVTAAGNVFRLVGAG